MFTSTTIKAHGRGVIEGLSKAGDILPRLPQLSPVNAAAMK
jgi:hypothetical protein